MNNAKRLAIFIPVLSVALIVAIAVNVALGIFADTLDALFVTHTVVSEVPDIDEAFEASKASAREVMNEGTVLLKNEDGLLPLANKTDKLNLFGWGSYEPVYSGYGSGGMRKQTDMAEFTTLRGGLEEAGYTVNDELMTAYKDYCAVRENPGNVTNHNYSIYELPASHYDSLVPRAKEFSDYAIITISRAGGEGDDIPMVGQMNDTDTGAGHYGVRDGASDTKHYLELSDKEESMVERVCASFDNVIVLVNSLNAMELGWLDEYDSIKSALWIGGPGTAGFASVADIIKGTVNPSGRLTDTYAYDVESAPSFDNFGYKTFYDPLVTGPNKSTLQFAAYAEGIYVGYRWYETAAFTGEIDYDSTVQYPFGYGLSYSTFKQTLGDCTVSDGIITMPVTVENTGSFAGKDVVQIYVTAPYAENKTEKAYVTLVGFAKTPEIEPKASETVTVTVEIEELASYDYKTNGCYVLDAGDYEFKLMKNSHEGYADETFTYHVSAEIVYGANNKRASDKAAAVNMFADCALDKASAEDANVTPMSRANFTGTLPSMNRYEFSSSYKLVNNSGAASYKSDVYVATPTDAIRNTIVYDGDADENKARVSDEPVTLGVPYLWTDFPYYDAATAHDSETVTIADMSRVEYDGVVGGVDQSEIWRKFIGEMSFDEMATMIYRGSGYGSAAIDSIDKPIMLDVDGPVGASSYQGNNNFDGCHYPISTIIACTWNVPLITEMGEVMGNEFASLGISGMYGPSVQIHRSPFGGRNWEYYSEDPLVSGHIGGAEVLGLRYAGIYAHLKHFAVNEQESGRENTGLYTWADEQTLREIYFKPFEIVVKKYNGTGIMSSFNRLGSLWTGGRYDLCTELLRGEWGFKGSVISDYYYLMATGGKFYMNIENGLYAGNDMWLNGLKMHDGFAFEAAKATNKDLNVMAAACKNACYMFSRGKLIENEASFPVWRVFWVIGDVLVFGGIAFGAVMLALGTVKVRRRAKENEVNNTLGE